jgi:hypothetical protein
MLLSLSAVSATAGARDQTPPMSRSLDLSIAVDTVRACATAEGAARIPVRLMLRNRSTAPVRVLPDTVRLAAVQAVRTVEEIVPSPVTTTGVTVLPPRAQGRGAARLLSPGRTITIERAVELVVASPAVPDEPGSFHPGHYFFEAVAVVESGTPGAGRFETQSTISPYVEVDVPSRSLPPCPSG